MQKDSQTTTKLQHKLFYCFKNIHSNTVLIPKFCHLYTGGNCVLDKQSLNSLRRKQLRKQLQVTKVTKSLRQIRKTNSNRISNKVP